MYALIAAIAIADIVNDVSYIAKGQHPYLTGEGWGPYLTSKTIAMGTAGATAGAGAALGAAVGPALSAGTTAATGATTGAATGATTGATVGGAVPAVGGVAAPVASGSVAPTVAAVTPSVAAGTLSTPASVTATQAGTAGLTGLESASSSASGISPSVTSTSLNESAITGFAESMKDLGSAGVEKAISGAGEQSLEQGIKSLGSQSLFNTIQEGIPNTGSFLQKATTGNAYVDAFKNIGRESFANSIREQAPNMISRGLQNAAAGAAKGAITDREDPGRGALAGGVSGLASSAVGGVTRSFIPTHPGNYLLPEKSDSLMGEFGTETAGPHISTYGDRLPGAAGKIAGGFTKSAIRQSMTPGLRRPDAFPYTQNPYYNKYAYDYA